MQMSVLVEPLKGNGYRVRSAEPFGVSAEGATREEALAKLRDQVARKIADGAEVTPLEVGPFVHPWARFAGTWREDDPFIAEWQKEVEEYRRQIDEDPDA